MNHSYRISQPFIILLFSLGAQNAAAQVFEGDLALFTQSEVDNFNFTEVTGSLNIGNLAQNRTSDIVDLSHLASLTRVGGDFSLFRTQTVDLNALSNLNTIGGNIRIRLNPNLESLADPTWPQEIKGELQME